MEQRTTSIDSQIGQMLVEGGFITKEQLEDALKTAQTEGKSLREVLVEKQYVNSETIATFISIYLRIPIVDLHQVVIEPEAVKLVPEDLARQYNVMPLAVEGDSLRVAMDNPNDIEAINTLQAATGKRIKPRLPVRGSVKETISQHYKMTPRISRELQSLLGPTEVEVPSEAPARAEAPAAPATPREVTEPLLTAEIAQAPVVKALDMIITQAVKDRASDIHIEPVEEALKVRYRIDGILHDAATLPKGAHSALLSRVKVLAGMDIAERRRPQDGHFTMEVQGGEVDFRVATIETAHGEMAVLRVLNRSASLMSLSELGFQPGALEAYNKLLTSPYGMVLVAGPTGSGKTTTLYASVAQLDAISNNIMTIEDPIEYRFPNINQIQVNEAAGITFAVGLRGIMRLDPDIILVGEIRDHETARVAVQAALTGHLVLTSIHANDAASAIVRLSDLGVERFLVTSAVIGSVSQRLVRKICPYCKSLAPVPPDEAAAYQQEMQEARTDFYKGRGCNMCSRTGYMGRIGVFEVLVMNDPIRALVTRGANAEEIRAEAIKSGMMTMRRDAMLKVKDGITTPREVLRNVFTIA